MIYKNELIVRTATNLNKSGFGKKDSLHLASAISVKTNYFITVDKGILNKRRILNDMKALSPIEYINILEENYA